MKADIVFGLESAAWPALLVDTRGVIMRANTAASHVFGAVLNGNPAVLSAVWSSENGQTVEQFLTQWEQSPTAVTTLKFRNTEGAVATCMATICAFLKDDRKWFVFQLLPAPAPAPAASADAPVASADSSANSPIPGPANDAKGTVDASGVLKQKLDCALQLARTVSLDFNNALTSVLGHTSLLLSKAEAGHPWRLSLMEVEKSASRAAEIANELQIFSRQEKEVRRSPPGNLNAVVNRCVEFFRNASGGKIEWKAQSERELFAARFDEAKIQQALTKILENAAEAVQEGGQIAVQSRNVELTQPTQDHNAQLSPGTYVCVEVADNGRGIDEDVLPRIFEPFFTTKQPPHRGLGLALVYGIVSNHGGGVAVASQSGQGTAVRVYLPAEKSFVRETADAGRNLHGKETVLLVDDENLLLTMGETILTEYGYKVLTANTGQKALATLSRDDTHIDLLVTDLVMPTMSGRELVERVRQLAPNTRILCTSGYILPAEKQSGTPYLQKPFTSRQLLVKVRQVLDAERGVD